MKEENITPINLINQPRIYVVGYPRSGNTWLSRLLNRILTKQEEIEDYLGRQYHNNLVLKSHDVLLNREQKTQCFSYSKQEQKTTEVFFPFVKRDYKIYIVRNVYDVLFSCLFFFKPYLGPTFYNNKKEKLFDVNYEDLCNTDNVLFNTIFHNYLHDIINKTEIPGSFWGLWDDHVMAGITNSDVWIKYEDLVSNPTEICKFILAQLSIDVLVDEKDLITAINEESIDQKKLKQDLNEPKSSIIRKGQIGDWKNYLNQVNKQLIWDQYYKTIKLLGYEEICQV